MRLIFWMFVGIPALIAAYGIARTAVRLARGTFPSEPSDLDAFGLIVVICGIMIFATWLFR